MKSYLVFNEALEAGAVGANCCLKDPRPPSNVGRDG